MLNVIVEDVLSETVMRRLLEQVGFQGESTFRMMRGNGKIRQGMPKFAVAASRFFPHIVLTDLDRYPCPLALMETWNMGSLPEALLFRIAVHEVESWLMADREKFAASLSLPIGKVPLNPDLEPDAKQCLFGLIRKSRKRRLRKELLPTVGSHIGPLYNDFFCQFVREHWQVEEAAKHSPSLGRSLDRLAAFCGKIAKR